MALDKTNTPNKDGVAGKGAAQAAPVADKPAVNEAMAAPAKPTGKMTKIEMLTCISFPHGTFNMGSIVEVPEVYAKNYIKSGAAKPVKG